MFHWSWLNAGFNTDIYKVWKQQGCYEEVHRRLGYRLVINKVRLVTTLSFDLDSVMNVGYIA